jgi:hypothetical protein
MCAQANPPSVLLLWGLFLLVPFAVAAVVIVLVRRASARPPGE